MKEKTMKKIFDLGKIDYYGRGRRINKVTIEIRLNATKEGKPVFSASGNIWNGRETDAVCGGQCLDDIFEISKDEKHGFSEKTKDLIKEIFGLWSRNHLNDIKPGTPEQMRALKKHFGNVGACDYEKHVEYLKRIGLYEVEYSGKPFKYGHSFVYFEISKDDMEAINRLFETNETPQK